MAVQLSFILRTSGVIIPEILCVCVAPLGEADVHERLVLVDIGHGERVRIITVT
jgi:hypothetical protein